MTLVMGGETYCSLLDGPAEATGQLAHTVARHALDDILAIRHDERDALVLRRVALDTNKPGGAELVDLGARAAVEVQRDAESFIPSALAEAEDWCVVATDLCGACSFRRGAVEVFEDQSSDRVYAVIDPDG